MNMKRRYYKEFINNYKSDNVWHVFPVNDLAKHEIDSDIVCWCNPKVEKQENNGLVVVHKSKDGREFREK
jgi:hypothetical protein